MARSPEPGVTIGGRYQLISRIATGGVGQIWLAQDTVLARPVAVKVLRNDVTHEPRAAARFRAEARSAAQLTDPGVAVVHDFGEHVATDGTWPYLVMELVPGESLRATLLHGPLDDDRTLDVLAQCASALAAAHARGLVHRDIKPANILVREDGVVKVTDFGLAVSSGAEPLTATGTILGTAAYISPEQARGGSATPASDVYALGLVAYECLSGRRAYGGDTVVEMLAVRTTEDLPALPAPVRRDLSDLVAHMTRRDPAERPSADEVSRRANAMRGRPTDAPRAVTQTAVMPALIEPDLPGDPTHDPLGTSILSTGWTTAGPPGGGRRRRLVGVAIGLCLLMLLATAFAATRGGGGSDGTVTQVQVPSVTGLNVTTAEERLREVGLVPVRRSADVADTRAGRVTKQSPPPAATAATGSKVTVTVASGQARVVADEYHNMTYAEAARALTALGMDPVRQDVPAVGTPGYVITASPSGRQPMGTDVTLTVVAAPAVAEPGDDRDDDNGKGRGKGNGKKGRD